MDDLFELMADNWLIFKKHVPAGAYLPVGQLDGDCRGCGAAWPCPTIREVMGHPPDVRMVDGRPATPLGSASWLG